MVCVQCDDVPSLNACPLEAIFIKELSEGRNIVHINRDLCVKCKQCIEACPF